MILAIGFVAFRFTKFGTYLKAIGAGEKAAMFSGIRTDRMKFLIYVLAGAITGFAAFINVIKVGSVTSSGGNQLETQILIALVLGCLLYTSFQNLSKTGRIDLKKVMSGENGAERVKNYSIPMAEGLVYNLSLIHISSGIQENRKSVSGKCKRCRKRRCRIVTANDR